MGTKSAARGLALACLSALVMPAHASANETPAAWGAFAFLGVTVPPGAIRQATWGVSETFSGTVLDTPILVARGARAGPTLCLTAGLHGDELNGVEIVRTVLETVAPGNLRGTLIGVPVVNLHGFRRSSRYLPDRRDLNRYFPGRPRGSTASRIAHAFFENVVRFCDDLIDLHTGSFHRANLPHVRADLDDPRAFELARGFGATIVVHSVGSPGTLRRAATHAGIPAITYEAGEPMRFELSDVVRGVQGIRNLMHAKGMLKAERAGSPHEVFRRSHWVRVDDGGILISRVELGDRVEPGDLLGTVTEPLSSERAELRAPHPGIVIGMALNQVVIPGFAAFHLGIRETEKGVVYEMDEDWSIEAVEEVVGESDEFPEE